MFFKTLYHTLEDRYKSDHKVKRRTKEFSKLFKHTNTKAILENEQVPKSPWKTMDGKGANTFPIHNLPPRTQKSQKNVFLYSFHPFLCWIKEKSVAALAYRDICEYKMKNQYIIIGSATISQKWRL